MDPSARLFSYKGDNEQCSWFAFCVFGCVSELYQFREGPAAADEKKKKNMQDFLFPAALGQSWWCEMLQADTKCHKTKLSDPIRCCRRERSHPPAPPRPSRSLSSLPRWLTLLPWQQVTRFLPSYINVPVIGEGGTTFLFVFLKNPSSGLLK